MANVTKTIIEDIVKSIINSKKSNNLLFNMGIEQILEKKF